MGVHGWGAMTQPWDLIRAIFKPSYKTIYCCYDLHISPLWSSSFTGREVKEGDWEPVVVIFEIFVSSLVIKRALVSV